MERLPELTSKVLFENFREIIRAKSAENQICLLTDDDIKFMLNEVAGKAPKILEENYRTLLDSVKKRDLVTIFTLNEHLFEGQDRESVWKELCRK